MAIDQRLIDEISLMKFIRPHLGRKGYAIRKTKTNFRSNDSNGLPVPPKDLWIGYGTTDQQYLETSTRHTNGMLDAVRATGFDPFVKGARILDFGCGAGRMIRQLFQYSDICQIYGCDLSGDHIIWAKQYLSPPFLFFINTSIPHLPFPDGYFHFVYCGSVFSHIDDLADTWLLELKRVTTPGSVVFITIHDENTVELLTRIKHRLADQVKADADYQKYKDDHEMLVIDRGTWSQVFYDTSSFKERLEYMGFAVRSIVPRAYGYQTGIVLQA